MAVNFLDDCFLCIPLNEYYEKIYRVLDDNFSLNLNCITPLEEKKECTMFLDLNTGDMKFELRNQSHVNYISEHRVVLVQYVLQVAAWLVFNSMVGQRKFLGIVFGSFYEYMFGPILTSIIFVEKSNTLYYSDIPYLYIQMLPVLTVTCDDVDEY